MTNHSAASRTISTISIATAFALLFFTTSARAQQDQSQQGQQQDQSQQQQQDQQGPPPQPTASSAPVYTPQDADRPPYSHDRPGPAYPSPTPNRQYQGQYPNQTPPPAQPSGPVPATLTLPAGTILNIRTNDFLSTDHSKVGDQFTATLDQPLIVNGWVVARRGQTIVGKVKDVKKAGRVKGTSELAVELTDLSIVDGRQLPILTELWKGSGGTSHGQDAATIVGTTGLGAAIGAAADWGTGAAIGAGAGAVAGIGAVLLTRGRPTVVPPESLLSFRLVDPVTIDTTQSQQAFAPVGQQDYASNHLNRRPGYPGPYPGPYAYPYGYNGPYVYPYPYYGFYYGYGRRGYWRRW